MIVEILYGFEALAVGCLDIKFSNTDRRSTHFNVYFPVVRKLDHAEYKRGRESP